MMKKKTLVFFFQFKLYGQAFFYCMRFTDLNVESLSNDDGNDNESAKKAVAQGSVYMEVGDPIVR